MWEGLVMDNLETRPLKNFRFFEGLVPRLGYGVRANFLDQASSKLTYCL